MPHKIIMLKEIRSVTVPVYNLNGEKIDEAELPPVFNFPVRKDLVRRAFHSALTAKLQPKGRDPLAGKRRVGESWGINHSVARVPRLDNGRAVFAPMTRGGRLTHPPRVEKVQHEEVNKKERVRAIASALAATAVPEIVRKRGHKFTCSELPVVISDEFEQIEKTSQGKEVLMKLCVWDDLIRAYEGRRIRAGKGKMRGRKHVVPKSLLIVVSREDSKVLKALRNLPGVDVVAVNLISVIHLAPGGVPGRLTLFTKKALSEIGRRFEVITP